MPSTYKLIQATTVSGFSTTTITFDNIPQTYDNLIVRWSAACPVNGTQVNFWLNNVDSTSTYSYVAGGNNGNLRAASSNIAYLFGGMGDARYDSASSNGELWIPSYRSSLNKTTMYQAVNGRNSSGAADLYYGSSLYRSGTAISRIDIKAGFNTYFFPLSTFRLYGTNNS
jgi:hypothetical protein